MKWLCHRGIELVGQAVDNKDLSLGPDEWIPTEEPGLFRAEYLRVLVVHCYAS